MYKSSIIADHTVSSYQQVVGNWISEDFYSKCICYDFLCLFVKVWMDECHVVIAGDTISEGW